MNIQQLLQSLAERFSASASVKIVCGDPVAVGNRTVDLEMMVLITGGVSWTLFELWPFRVPC
jgi:hypothetical protein